MIKKIIIGLVASLIVFIVLALLLKPKLLHHSKIWVLVGIGLLASIQPAYNPVDRNAPAEDKGTADQLV